MAMLKKGLCFLSRASVVQVFTNTGLPKNSLQVCKSISSSPITRGNGGTASKRYFGLPKVGQQESSPLSAANLMEFYDNEANWEETTVKTGRSWAKAELRTLSNVDLHKLWYVLLKEMNMLLTMQGEYHRFAAKIHNEERIEKVEVSMDNLQDVVYERDRAISLLETGEEPHPRWIDDVDELGREIRRLEEEHFVPKENNKEFMKRYDHIDQDWVNKFKRLYNEKQRNSKRYYRRIARKLYWKLLDKYPHLEEDPEFVMQYCLDQVTPTEKNPDLEKLMKEERDKE